MKFYQRGQTLAASLIVIVIIAILAVVLMKGSGVFGSGQSPRKDGRGTTVPGLVKAQAEDTVCRSNLGQLRTALEIAKMSNEDQWPTTLSEARLSSDFYTCPMGKGKEPYSYNPATGQVRCIHPGHERF